MRASNGMNFRYSHLIFFSDQIHQASTSECSEWNFHFAVVICVFCACLVFIKLNISANFLGFFLSIAVKLERRLWNLCEFQLNQNNKHFHRSQFAAPPCHWNRTSQLWLCGEKSLEKSTTQKMFVSFFLEKNYINVQEKKTMAKRQQRTMPKN